MRHPVTASDVDDVVASAADLLIGALDLDWHVPAGDLEWTCWETLEHVSDDLFAYAGQLGPRRPPVDTHVPFSWVRRRPEGPANSIFADAEAGNAGLVQVLEASGTFLSAVVRTVPPDRRAHHVFGLADPEGFAAMGVVEVLVHLADVAAGLELSWRPGDDLCERVLARLFPEVVPVESGWDSLLWATGRIALPDRPRRAEWRWRSDPPERVR